MALTTFTTGRLSVRKAAAVKRRAKELGLTTKVYLTQLIEDDLTLSAKAKASTFDELAAPFRKALGHLSEEELDRRVEAARTAHYRERSTKRRKT